MVQLLRVVVGAGAWDGQLAGRFFVIEVEFSLFKRGLSTVNPDKHGAVCVGAGTRYDSIWVHGLRIVDCFCEVLTPRPKRIRLPRLPKHRPLSLLTVIFLLQVPKARPKIVPVRRR